MKKHKERRRKVWMGLAVLLWTAGSLLGVGPNGPPAKVHAAGNIITVIPEMVTNESGVGNAWKLFDEQELVGDPKGGSGGTGLRLSGQWNPTGATYPLYAYVNLGQTYDLTDIYFLDTFNGAKAVFYAGSPGNWSKLFEDNLGGYNQWRGQSASARTQYIRIELSAQTAEMAEIVLYGTPYGAADTTPPVAVADLAAGSATPASLTLSWTAPGDDGGTGTALAYDIRYSTSPITDDTSWNSATKATGEPAPALAGTGQSLKLTGLGTNTSYYFAMKTYDKVGNLSSLSNLPTGATDPDGVKLVLTPAMVMDESNTGKADKLVDEQAENQAGDPKNGSGGTQSTITTQNQWTSDTVAYPLYAYLDLEQPYKLTDIYIFDTYNGGDATFYSGSPGNWTEMFTDPLTGYMSWNKHDDDVVGTTTRYVRVKLDNRLAEMAEIVLYGTPAGSPPADTTAPADVEDLAAVSSTANSVTLTWTAPGDDGDTGTAASYDIRYSTTDITDVASWNGATPVTGVPAPGAAYTNESFTVVGLSADTTYYFALKTSDEAGNVSTISNVPHIATTSPSGTSVQLTLNRSMIVNESGVGNAGKLLDQQGDVGNPRGGTGKTNQNSNGAIKIADQWNPGYNNDGYPLYAYIDLEQMYYIDDIYWLDAHGGGKVNFYKGTPGNWSLLFDTTLPYFDTWDNWGNWLEPGQSKGVVTRYIRIELTQQSAAMAEIVLYGYPLNGDTTKPSTIIDLTPTGIQSGSVTLSWTAPGDDGNAGAATTYDIRYSTAPISGLNWASATQVAGEPVPAAANTPESMTVTGLSPKHKYYFAIRADDDVMHSSDLSNVANATTLSTPVGYALKGATTIDVHAKLSEAGTVYYALYSTAQSGMTASALKAAAQGPTGGNLLRGGAIAFASGDVGSELVRYLTGLPDNATYYMYMVGEGQSSGLGAVYDYPLVMPKRLQVFGFTSANPNRGYVKYWMYAPEAYYKNPDANYPLMVNLHGGAQRGTNINQLLETGMPRIINEGTEFPFIVLSPQLPSGDWTTTGYTDEFVERVRGTYRVDSKRIYVSGYSLGGGGSFYYASEQPAKVAAIVPVASVKTLTPTSACNLKEIPIKAFHNDEDPAVSYLRSQEMMNMIAACSPPPTVDQTLTILDSNVHGGWDEIFKDPAVVSWVMSQSKP